MWEFYRELCSFGINVVAPSEIDAWARLKGIVFPPSEASLIARIQQAYWLSKDPKRRNRRQHFARVSEISGAKVVPSKAAQLATVPPKTRIKK